MDLQWKTQQASGNPARVDYGNCRTKVVAINIRFDPDSHTTYTHGNLYYYKYIEQRQTYTEEKSRG